jgi:hypothetical protein
MLQPDQFCAKLVDAGIAQPRDIRGCSDQDVRIIQHSLDVVLPQAYVQFLQAVGRKAGSLMRDIDYQYDCIERINADARRIIENWEEGRLQLPENAFVFSMRQGEQFMFFIADGRSEDPPVYYYVEGGGCFTRIAESFWDVIEREMAVQQQYGRDS